MTGYRLLTYSTDGSAPRPGLLVGDRVADLEQSVAGQADLGFSPATTLSVLDGWDAARPVLEALAADSRIETRSLSDVRLHAPLLYPGTIICAASNNVSHQAEMPNKGVGREDWQPYFFLKATRQTVIGPGEAIRLPEDYTQKVDWETEIAVVIGRPARRVSAEDAYDYVAGYTIMNDLSARDRMRRKDWPNRSNWFAQKSFDTSAPMGPWITPVSEVPDPHDLAMQLWVNDEIMQDGTSREMWFDIPTQIAYLSQQMTLLPGDVIATGTCGGVGFPRGLFLKPGDHVRITIERLGTIENPVIADI